MRESETDSPIQKRANYRNIPSILIGEVQYEKFLLIDGKSNQSNMRCSYRELDRIKSSQLEQLFTRKDSFEIEDMPATQESENQSKVGEVSVQLPPKITKRVLNYISKQMNISVLVNARDRKSAFTQQWVKQFILPIIREPIPQNLNNSHIRFPYPSSFEDSINPQRQLAQILNIDDAFLVNKEQNSQNTLVQMKIIEMCEIATHINSTEKLSLTQCQQLEGCKILKFVSRSYNNEKQLKSDAPSNSSQFHGLSRILLFSILDVLKDKNIACLNIPDSIKPALHRCSQLIKESGYIGSQKGMDFNELKQAGTTKKRRPDYFNHSHYKALFLLLTPDSVRELRESEKDIQIHKFAFNIDLSSTILNQTELAFINIIKIFAFQIFVSSFQESIKFLKEHEDTEVTLLQNIILDTIAGKRRKPISKRKIQTLSKNIRVLYIIRAFESIRMLAQGISVFRF